MALTPEAIEKLKRISQRLADIEDYGTGINADNVQMEDIEDVKKELDNNEDDFKRCEEAISNFEKLAKSP
jgi:hypothetical protein